MKRFAIVALLAATLFGATSASAATELKVKGNLDVYGMWSANLGDFDSDTADADNYFTTQRMRTYFTYQANENLKGVLGLEMDAVWGNGDAGDWGTDGNGNIEVKHAYIDFNFPDTAVNVKAGLQSVALPSVFGNPVFDDDAAALVVSAPINDMFALTAGYTRGVDGNFNADGTSQDGNDNVDMFFLAAPVTLDGFDVTPYFAYASVGDKANNAFGVNAKNAGIQAVTSAAGANLLDSTIWVVGANANLTLLDPLTFAADLIYGQADGDDYDTKGWYGALAATYKFDMLSATVFGTYATGADEDADEDNYLPTLAEGWGLSPYVGGVRAFSGSYDSFSGVANDGTGVWSVGLSLDDISFVENLSHKLMIAYVAGTSDENAGVGFDEEDSAIEVYMVNKYMIYENLAAINELGYFSPDLDNFDDEDASYFATIGLSYKF